MLNLLLIISNYLGWFIILVIAFYLFIIEKNSIKKYQKEDSKFLQKIINLLKTNIINRKISLDNNNQDINNWIIRHLKGKIDGSIFIPELSNNCYIFLSYPRFLTNSPPRSPVYYAPTLLTALGILGTFFGIFLGLQEIGISGINNTTSLLESSTQLLEGMKTAFSTSLAGMSTAIFMMWYLAKGVNLRQNHQNKLRQELDKITIVESSQKLLSNLDTSCFLTVTESLDNLANNLNCLTNLTPANIASAIAETIVQEKAIIVEELQAQNRHLQYFTPQSIVQAVTPIQKELISLKQIQIEQQSTVQLLVKELGNELIESVVKRLDQSAKLTQEASEAVKELKAELGSITESLATAVQTIQEFQQDTLVRLQQFAESLQGILNQFGSDTKGVLQQVSEEINQAVAESIKGMEAQREAFEVSANSASNSFRGIREDLQEALITQSNQQKEMLEGVKNSTESILEKTNFAFTQQTETIINVGKEASQLMNQAKENLLETLMNIDDILDKTRVNLQEELEIFRLEYQADLTLFFQQQNNLLEETLGKQKEGLSEVVTNLKITFKEESLNRKKLGEEVNDSLVKIQDSTKIVSDLVNLVGLTSGERFIQLQEISNTIANQAQSVENHYQKMNQQFSNNLEKITDKFEENIRKIVAEFAQLSATTNQQINDYLTNASNSYHNSFMEADKAMANICSQLNDTSHGLMNVAEYLVASANDLKHQN